MTIRKTYDEEAYYRAMDAAALAYEAAVEPAREAYYETELLAREELEDALALARRWDGTADWAAIDRAWTAYDNAIRPTQQAYEEAKMLADRAYEEAVAPFRSLGRM